MCWIESIFISLNLPMYSTNTGLLTAVVAQKQRDPLHRRNLSGCKRPILRSIQGKLKIGSSQRPISTFPLVPRQNLPDKLL